MRNNVGLATASAETRLLLALARRELSVVDTTLIRSICRNADWTLFFAMATKHRLLPLAFLHLRQMAPCPLPRNMFAAMWRHSEIISRRNKEMAAELLELVKLFDEHSIPIIPYKGPTLALTVYGDIALREFGDLDLLLRTADILRAKELLATRGYQPDCPLAPAVEAAFLRSSAHYHWMLVREHPSMLVELHWKTGSEFQVEPGHDDRWWATLATTKIDELDVRSFAPRELALILCLHGSKHHWASLGWLVDVAEFIRQQPELDWDWMMARAGELRATRRLAFGLFLMRKLLDVALPDVVLAWLATQPEAADLAETIVGSLFDPTAPQPDPWQRLRLNFRLYDHWDQRLRHAVDVTFSPGMQEWARWPLPRPLFFIYAPLRLFALVWKYSAKRLKGH